MTSEPEDKEVPRPRPWGHGVPCSPRPLRPPHPSRPAPSPSARRPARAERGQATVKAHGVVDAIVSRGWRAAISRLMIVSASKSQREPNSQKAVHRPIPTSSPSQRENCNLQCHGTLLPGSRARRAAHPAGGRWKRASKGNCSRQCAGTLPPGSSPCGELCRLPPLCVHGVACLPSSSLNSDHRGEWLAPHLLELWTKHAGSWLLVEARPDLRL